MPNTPSPVPPGACVPVGSVFRFSFASRKEPLVPADTKLTLVSMVNAPVGGNGEDRLGTPRQMKGKFWPVPAEKLAWPPELLPYGGAALVIPWQAVVVLGSSQAPASMSLFTFPHHRVGPVAMLVFHFVASIAVPSKLSSNQVTAKLDAGSTRHAASVASMIARTESCGHSLSPPKSLSPPESRARGSQKRLAPVRPILGKLNPLTSRLQDIAASMVSGGLSEFHTRRAGNRCRGLGSTSLDPVIGRAPQCGCRSTSECPRGSRSTRPARELTRAAWHKQLSGYV